MSEAFPAPAPRLAEAHPLEAHCRHRDRHRRLLGGTRPARLGRQRVVQRGLGHDDRDLARLPRRRARAPRPRRRSSPASVGSRSCGTPTKPTSAKSVSSRRTRSASPSAAGFRPTSARSSRCSCSWRSSPARRSPASSPGSSSEDLLHGGRDVRLPVPLPIRLRVVRPRVPEASRTPRCLRRHRRARGRALVVLGRVFWQKLKGLWLKAKVGGRVLSYPACTSARSRCRSSSAGAC